jgi:UDP-N-acetylmuramate: L-alanyl-gamma-D-glutamyl-meso-diaminopimelate ligase
MISATKLPEKVHLTGACGTGMAALACLLRQAGLEVSGSDAAAYPPMSEVLERLGLVLHRGFDAAHLEPPPDLVVIGNAISRGNPEAEAVLNRGLRYASLPEALAGLFLRHRRVLAVAGTHGKTTTTALLAYLLDRGGKAPSFFMGGQPIDFPDPARLGDGGDFVVEADEYDSAFFDKEPKFLHYRPRVLVVGAVEYDHADIYPDLESILLRFRRLLRMVPGGGRVLLGFECPVARGLMAHAYTPVETFGLVDEADWWADRIEEGPDGVRFRIHGPRAGGPWPTRLALSGEFNVRNTLGAVAAAAAAGLAPADAARLLPDFRGVRRRLEMHAEVEGVRIYDDFAHHPTAVRVTLRALRQREPGRRLVAVLEPRSNTLRRRVLQDDLAQALTLADEVLIAPVHRAHLLEDDERLDPGDLASRVAGLGVPARAPTGAEAMLEDLCDVLGPGDCVVLMSNGDFGGLNDRLTRALARSDQG